MPAESPDPDPGPVLVAAPRPRWRVAVGAAVVLLLAGLGAAVVAGMLAPRGGGVVVATPGPSGSAAGGGEVFTVVVDVLGAVQRPGLYHLEEGSRVVDAIAAAGGFAPDAERSALNLARVVIDAEQIVVPVIGAAPPAGAGPPGVAADGRVNLNTADRAALETLPRIGPAMADRIIAWRTANGGFRSVDDLLQISGIGQKTFESLQPLVTL